MRITGKVIVTTALLILAGCSMPYQKPDSAPPDHLTTPPANTDARPAPGTPSQPRQDAGKAAPGNAGGYSSAGQVSSEKQNTATGNGMDQPAPNGSGYSPAVAPKH